MIWGTTDHQSASLWTIEKKKIIEWVLWEQTSGHHEGGEGDCELSACMPYPCGCHLQCKVAWIVGEGRKVNAVHLSFWQAFNQCLQQCSCVWAPLIVAWLVHKDWHVCGLKASWWVCSHVWWEERQCIENKERFRLSVRKTIFYPPMKAVSQLNKLPREVVPSLSSRSLRPDWA